MFVESGAVKAKANANPCASLSIDVLEFLVEPRAPLVALAESDTLRYLRSKHTPTVQAGKPLLAMVEFMLDYFDGGRRWTKLQAYRNEDGSPSQGPEAYVHHGVVPFKACLLGAAAFAAVALGIDRRQGLRMFERAWGEDVPRYNDAPERLWCEVEQRLSRTRSLYAQGWACRIAA